VIKPLTILLALSLITKISFAQLEADHWMFNTSHYVDFHHATNPDTTSYPSFQLISLNYGTISYSDKNGNLLFYGGGGYIYDRNFQTFPSLWVYPTTNDPLYSTYGIGGATQTILAIPYPGHDSLYIVFHLRSDAANQYHAQLYYSVINMNLRNGLGEIQPAQKNIQLLNGVEVGYKLTAILHCNKHDVWVIGHLSNSDQYFSLLVTSAGISATPVYFTGNFIPYTGAASEYSRNLGCMKLSALGNRLAAAFKGMDFIELFDFNNQTGIGINIKSITAHPSYQDTAYFPWHVSDYGPVGVDFSPSGNRIYVTSNYDLNNTNSYGYGAFIYQFDASLPTEVQIQNSEYRIDSLVGYDAGAIQMGNNGKMYVNVIDHLFEIGNPENLGAACNYTPFAVFSGQQYPNGNLPTFLQSYFQYPVIANGNCHFQNINFSIQNLVGVTSILWDFGDPTSGINNSSTSFTPTHIFTQQGYFLVKAILYNANGCAPDTVRKQVYAGEFQVFLGNDTTICQGDTLRLHMNIPNADNLWSNNSADTLIKVTQTGTYWVRVSLGECTATDTINVTVRQLPVFSLGNDTTICGSQPFTLTPNPNPSNVSYLWNTGSINSSINTSSAGQYWLKVKENGYVCEYKDTIAIQFRALPNFSLGNDTSLCQKDTLALNAHVDSATNYLWNTGDTTSQIKIYQSNIYWADVTKDNCTYRDSISAIFKPLPLVNLGSDTTICEDQTLLLNATNPNSQYNWQDNSVAPTFLVRQQGQYWVKVTMSGCSTSDTIKVQYDLKPKFTLGANFGICEGMSITLQPNIQNSAGVSYLWQNGSTTPAFTITQPGIYTLTITNYCGNSFQSVTVSKGVCKLYLPSAFSPNNDGLNDIFRAKYGEDVTEFHLQVFNRWGQVVFESKNINAGWNGNFRGMQQPVGEYVWMVRFKTNSDPKEQMMKGTVMLIR